MNEEQIQFSDFHPPQDDIKQDIVDGLSGKQKRIPPKYFYDQTGSQLFARLCHTREYYLTRTEKQILRDNLDEISTLIDSNSILLEPGAGNTDKVRILLEEIRPSTYVPMDISKDYLRQSAQALANDYPWLHVHAACADYAGIDKVPVSKHHRRRVVFFPGSSIGNFEPRQAQQFLTLLSGVLGSGGGLLIGVDLHKERKILHAAYNDSEGLTREFNLNLLSRINRELGANFNIRSFWHHAFYHQAKHRIEMHLVSRCRQTVRIGTRAFDFDEGETIHTENSYKYSIDSFHHIARASGFTPSRVWTDEKEMFSVHFLRVTP